MSATETVRGCFVIMISVDPERPKTLQFLDLPLCDANQKFPYNQLSAIDAAFKYVNKARALPVLIPCGRHAETQYSSCGFAGDDHRGLLHHQAEHDAWMLPAAEGDTDQFTNPRPDLHPRDQLHSHGLICGGCGRIPNSGPNRKCLWLVFPQPCHFSSPNSGCLFLPLSFCFSFLLKVSV